jgi:collagen triple helix repeat protein
MLKHLKPGTIVGVIAIVLAFVGTATATTVKIVTTKDIADGTIRNQDIHKDSVSLNRLSEGVQELIAGSSADSCVPGVAGKDGAQGPKGDTGATGPKGEQGPAGKDGNDGARGPKGDTGLAGAYYSVAFYDVGDTNAGAIATVACKEQTDTAISGGVQTVGLDEGANQRNTPVSSSFPGRMDWSTNTPRPDRLDGWVVQFGGNAGATSDKAPEKAKVWALCVPNLNIPVETTFKQSAG